MQRLLIFFSFILFSFNAFAQSKEKQFIKIDANYPKITEEALSTGNTTNEESRASYGSLQNAVGALDNILAEKSAISTLKEEQYLAVQRHVKNTTSMDPVHNPNVEDFAILYKMKDNIIRRALAFEPKKRWLIWT